MAELTAKNAETLANMDSEDMGKPITQARGEQAGSTPLFDYYAGLADKIEGTVHPVGDDFFNYTMLEPIGVVAGIAPWNFPTWMFCMKVAPPLACGCTMVFKPAGISPRSSLLMGSLSKEAGIPDGVVNVVTGEGSKMGNALVGHAGVNHVSLTGSSPVGKRVAETSARHLAGAILELGGKTPNIIFADAPWEEAVNGSMVGAFINCGQVCVSASRLLVEEKIKDDFVAEMVKRAKKLKLGDPKKEDTTLGPICSKGQYETVTSYIEVGKKEGAKVLIGGGTPSEPSLSKGFYVLPTIFDGVKNEMKIAQEEIFGPVVSVVTFKDEEDAIAKANDICYGLEACIWTKDLRRAHRMARRIEAGIICVNCWGLTHAAVPYAGFKDSGMGVESGLSAIESYTRKKNVWVRMSEVTAQWP
jgi:aldehyde dehydrogenase (NAD+)